MRIAGWPELAAFYVKGTPAGKEIGCWFMEMQEGCWKSATELLRDYPKAENAGASRYRFRFSGGLQVTVQFDFREQAALILPAAKSKRTVSKKLSPC